MSPLSNYRVGRTTRFKRKEASGTQQQSVDSFSSQMSTKSSLKTRFLKFIRPSESPIERADSAIDAEYSVDSSTLEESALQSTDTMSSLQFAKLCNITVVEEEEDEEYCDTASTLQFPNERKWSTVSNVTSNQTTASSAVSSRARRTSILGIDWSSPSPQSPISPFCTPLPTCQSPPPIITFEDEESIEIKGRFTVTRRNSVPLNAFNSKRRFSLVESSTTNQSLSPLPLEMSKSVESSRSPLSQFSNQGF
jgi:hypothetical protein